MELDNMKQLWNKMDDAISKQQAMNESIIKRMLHERNTSSLKSIMNMEWLGIALSAIALLILLGQISRVSNSTGMILCYAVTLLLLVAASFLGLYKIQYLSKLNAGTEPVSNMAEKIERFRLMIARERIASIILGPVLVAMSYVVILYLVMGINILDNPAKFLPLIGIAVGAYMVTVLALYKKLYFNQISAINNNLKEIADFKK